MKEMSEDPKSFYFVVPTTRISPLDDQDDDVEGKRVRVTRGHL